MRLAFEKITGAHKLAPADQATADYVEKLRVGEGIECKVSKMRNSRFHRLVFGFLIDAYDNRPDVFPLKMMDFDKFRKAVTIKAGYCTPTYRLDENDNWVVQYEADSLSYGNMDEDEFHEFFEKAKQAVIDMGVMDVDTVLMY